MTRNETIELAKRQFVEDTEQGAAGERVALPEVARTLGGWTEGEIAAINDLVVDMGLAALGDIIEESKARTSATVKSELLDRVRAAVVDYRDACERLGRMTANGAADEMTRDEFEWTVRDAVDLGVGRQIVWPDASMGVAINGMISFGWKALDWASYEVTRG